MKRKFVSFPIADFQHTRKQMLNWGNRFNICSFLDNHQYSSRHHTVECLLAAGCLQRITSFEEARRHSSDWLFGHLSYDLKNTFEALVSKHPDGIGFADFGFFVPEFVVQLASKSISIGSFGENHDAVLQQILSSVAETAGIGSSHRKRASEPLNRMTRDEYLTAVAQLKAHILHGDCYEVNFCQEFYIENIQLNPLQLFQRLSVVSPNPFSAFYKDENRYLLCLSPERFLRRENNRVISQPIKGTAPRSDDETIDRQLANSLRQSAKERAENIMIVDLVRNDLSKVCQKGSVQVDELCGIYTFPHVHHMISTVSGEADPALHWTDMIRATFPMGSMTGAPKKRAMELIETYERSRRGLFSGSIGYVEPGGNFDFNVVIRSVLYNSATGYLSFHTGSAITFNSDPEQEYEECLLKASAIKKALAETNTFI